MIVAGRREKKPVTRSTPSVGTNPPVGGTTGERYAETLYVSELQDLYSAEQQLVKALPKMVKNAESQELSDALESHLEETRNQVARLKEIFESLGENPKRKKYAGMEGIVKEGGEAIDEFDGKLLDVALISVAQGWSTSKSLPTGRLAPTPGNRCEDLAMLKETLEEEKRADEKLTQLSETINQEALNLPEEEERSERASPKGSARLRKSRTTA